MSRREDELLKDLVRLGEMEVDLLVKVYQLLSHEAVTAVVTLEGDTMSLAVGTTGTATLGFVDAAGDAAQAPNGDGSGLTVSFSIDDTSVATVGAATQGTDSSGNINYTATVTAVSAGTYNMSATVANDSGADMFDDDGVTAFVQPTAEPGTITASTTSQATTAVITVP